MLFKLEVVVLYLATDLETNFSRSKSKFRVPRLDAGREKSGTVKSRRKRSANVMQDQVLRRSGYIIAFSERQSGPVIKR